MNSDDNIMNIKGSTDKYLYTNMIFQEYILYNINIYL